MAPKKDAKTADRPVTKRAPANSIAAAKKSTAPKTVTAAKTTAAKRPSKAAPTKAALLEHAANDGSYHPAVDAYIEKSAAFAQPILTLLRETMHAAVPGVTEQMKWSMPFFVHRGVILGNMSAFKAHCAFGVWGKEAAETLRSEGLLAGTGSMGSFGRITSLEDLPPLADLKRYVQTAVQAIETGARTKAWSRPRVAKVEAEVPEALAAALKKNSAVAEQFAAMSPSCRREYCDWIADAKRDETRDKRVATTLEWVAEGKSRNWKYENR